MILKTVAVGLMQANCYILGCRENTTAIIIDPGGDEDVIKRLLEKYKLKPGFIINTHGHFDHIGCDNSFNVPVYIHKKDSNALSYEIGDRIRCLDDGEIIKSDGIVLKVIHVPGHTPGGIALLMLRPKDKILFTGDTLFYQGIGRSDLPFGNEKLLMKSIKEKILMLQDNTVIYPGHGPSSTIGDEKKNNPFL
jgi:glyoxylase-like metal-dependent hydrolase (beta-lactamase superfamily II)